MTESTADKSKKLLEKISRISAHDELVRRKRAREGLIPFVEYTMPAYETAAHHRLIADKLEAVERGDINRLMVFTPPRSGKSQLISRHFPAWFLGKNPSKQIITSSANTDLASDFGRDVRNMVSSDEYHRIFSVDLAADSQAAGKWHTDKGGVYIAAGVLSLITGRGAHLLVIDDPIKDRKDADSETIRADIWDWYRSVAYPRLMPGGAIVIVLTRWHEDDLAGRLLEGSSEKWEVVELPAIAKKEDPLGREEGAALWPEWFPLETLKTTQMEMGPREWSALYQQSPISEEGMYFKTDWLRYYDKVPKHLTIWGASDYAVTADGGDYTVHGVMGLDENEDMYLLDWWRGREESQTWVEVFLNMSQQHKPITWGEENGQIIKSLGPFITKRMQERKLYFHREQFSSARDKATRARSIQGRMSMGKVFLPRNAPWTEPLVSELLSFPFGKHDDQVDVLSLFGRMMDESYGKIKPKVRKVLSVTAGENIINLLERKPKMRRYA